LQIYGRDPFKANFLFANRAFSDSGN